jgi:predicted SprT family Zn-dependent metalloprotease
VPSEPAAKKTVSHADVTALMAIRPGGKDWQTVLKKVTRPQKQPTSVQTQEKGARRLIF